MRRSLLLLFSLFVVPGCIYPHHNLKAPPRQAPLPNRIDAYEHLRPVGRLDIYYGHRRDTTYSIKLQNGLSVYYTEDLLPVVSLDSATAKWSRDERSIRRSAIPWLFPALGLYAVSLISLNAALATDGFEINEKALILSGVSLLAAIPPTVILAVKNRRSNKARDAAFASFDDSLREYLNLCEAPEDSDEEFVDCDAASVQQVEPLYSPAPEN